VGKFFCLHYIGTVRENPVKFHKKIKKFCPDFSKAQKEHQSCPHLKMQTPIFCPQSDPTGADFRFFAFFRESFLTNTEESV